MPDPSRVAGCRLTNSLFYSMPGGAPRGVDAGGSPPEGPGVGREAYSPPFSGASSGSEE
jgi:hypothetical protein